MLLKKQMVEKGNTYFRHRSYIPFIVLPAFLASLSQVSYPFNSHILYLVWSAVCIFIAFAGLAIRIVTIGYVTKGTSGRNTKQQVAEKLNTTGAYSVVRHPLYLGNFIITLGVTMLLRSWWLFIIVMLSFFVYYERIILAEEEFLLQKFRNRFLTWAEKTPTFLPNFRLWKRPDVPFSLKTAVRREYHGFFAILIAFSLLDVTGEFIIRGVQDIDPVWIAVLFLGLSGYLVVRSIAKFTTFLVEENRY